MNDRPSPGDGVAEGIVAAIRAVTDARPVAGIVLGSGLGEAIRVAKEAAGVNDGAEFAFSDLPGMPPPSVPGHMGRLWIGDLGGRPVAIFQGRIHFYEGHGMPSASLTSQVSSGLGAGTMVLTAAVGAIDASLRGGSLSVIRDHINTMGTNPLLGWRMPDGSPAFVGLGDVYDPDLSEAALAAARARAADASAVTEGVYAAVSGPAYETPAETEFLRRAGGTVVGMSMVPEAVAARALGMRVLGLSFVTNAAGALVSHQEVLEASAAAAGTIGLTLADLVERF
ncbi:MAG: purine-nucleoside phosphorylase [Actinobacteria bacterium]|nr:purine-nucleoside phosphorylase [Actinomycetota bacterium]